MLEHPGRVAHPLDRCQTGCERRQRMACRGEPARLRSDRGVDLVERGLGGARPDHRASACIGAFGETPAFAVVRQRSEEHTSELQSLMRISYAVFCLKKK